MHRVFGFPAHIRILSLFDNASEIKAHGNYTAAKAGDAKAALDLVFDLAIGWLSANGDRFALPCTFVAPHAKEISGDNAIPQTLAAVCSVLFRGNVDTSIVQTDRVYHTGADPMERLAARAEFEGIVQKGCRYVLVDGKFAYSKKGFIMSSSPSLVSNQTPSPQTRPVTSSVSNQLTRSEIDLLRQSKKSIADYVQKVLPERLARLQKS